MEMIKTLLDPLLEKQLLGHKKAITALDYSSDSQKIVTSSLDNTIVLWNLHGKERINKFQGHDDSVMDVAFSSCGQYIASASRDKTVRLWVSSGSTGYLKGHIQTVRSVQFSPDGSKILTASDDKTMKLWCSKRKKLLSSFVGHENWIRCARFSNDGKVIASCSDDKTTKLWNPVNAECIHTINDGKSHGISLSWHPSGSYVAVGLSDGTVKIHDTRNLAHIILAQFYSIHNDWVTSLSFNPCAKYIVSCSKDGDIKIMDLVDGKTSFTLTGHRGSVNAVSFSPTGNSLASAGNDRKLFLWKTNPTDSQLRTDHVENPEKNIDKDKNPC